MHLQWGKIKTILIVILLLVDTFLAGVLVVKWASEQKREQEMFKNLQIVLADNGITMKEMSLPKEAMMPQLIIDQSRTDELKLAHKLLGDDAEQINGDKSLSLKSEFGEVSWNDSGEINAVITPKGYKKPDEGSVKNEADNLLKNMGINESGLQIDINGFVAVASFKTAGYEVFNRNLKIVFSDDSITISGKWTFSEPYATRNNLYSTYNPIDSIIWFAGQKKANEIYDITAGLLLVNGAGSQMQLSPVWRIKTDNGYFYVDPVKNEVV